MPKYNEIIHEWDAPQEIVSYDAMKLRSGWKKTTVRVIIFVAVIEIMFFIPIYLFITNSHTAEYSVERSSLILPFLSGIPLAAIWLFLLYGLYPIYLRKAKITYRITDTGIEMQKNHETFFSPWKRIKGYWLKNHESLPQYTVLICNIRKFSRPIPLTENVDQESLISTLDKYIPLIEDPSRYDKIKLTGRQKSWLSMLTLGYILASFALFNHWNAIVFLFLGTLYIGPGTIGMTIYYRKKFFSKPELKSYAILFNMAAAFLMLYSVGILSLTILINNIE